MNPTGFGRQFLADLMHLPLIFKLFILGSISAAGWNRWKARRQAAKVAASEGWPVYKARVVWAQISDWRYEGEDGPPYLEGLLTYSYTVPGHDLEVGEYRRRFEDQREADAWARALRDTFVDVRVDPADVTNSVWQETLSMMTASPSLPKLDASRFHQIESWGVHEVLATAVFCVAAVGAFLAAWIQFSCIAGKPLISAEGNEAAFFGMHIGAILCAIAVSFVAPRGKWSASALQRSFKVAANSPAMKILGFYTSAVFFYGWVLIAARDGDTRYFGTLMFSAVWLMFYIGAAASAMEVMRHRGGDRN